MWISRREYKELHEQNTEIAATGLRDIGHLHGLNTKLEAENSRLRADMDWFKHRLNQVERERGQLIQNSIGIKIAIPEFIPTGDEMADTLHAMPDTSTVGGDAHEDDAPPLDYTLMDPAPTPDYSAMPRRR